MSTRTRVCPLLPLWVVLTVLSGTSGSLAWSLEPDEAEVSSSEKDVPFPPHELLHATLWVQTSAEWASLTRQAYHWAARSLDDALRSPDWTAALEQTEGYRGLPPAIILDVDETVLDNSFYEAQLIRDRVKYGSATWDPWVMQERCPPVPGVTKFLEHAVSRGVSVFYVTNRKDHLREATRNNLQKLGLPLDPKRETILTRSEESDKGTRRSAVAKTHRILLLVGDNNGDFASEFDGKTPEERAALVTRFSDYWGTRWISIPNPMYGAWEGAVVKHDYRVSPEKLLERKYRALQFEPQQEAALKEIRRELGIGIAVSQSFLRHRKVSPKTLYGFEVTAIDEGTPAAVAGLAPGDVLLQWEGKPVRSVTELREWVSGSSRRQPLKVKYARQREDATEPSRDPWQIEEAWLRPGPVRQRASF